MSKEKIVIPDNLKVKTAEINTLIVTGDAMFQGTLTLENGVRIDTKGPRPECDTDTRGTIWVTQSNNETGRDEIEACIKDKGIYVWQLLNQ